MIRKFLEVRGIVQGIGFRPFVYRIAKETGVTGYVRNDSRCVFLEVQGDNIEVGKFLKKLYEEYPKAGEIFEIISKDISIIEGEKEFIIEKSAESEEILPVIPPDIAICEDCKKEFFDSKDRRYKYPFISCTNCGPRFSIIENVPYDRPNTSMNIFEMCKECHKEYKNVLHRRFHAQPISCFSCGPTLELWNNEGKIVTEYQGNVQEYFEKIFFTIAEKIKEGYIIAFKGIGGFQLMCDATNDKVVLELRNRKHREEKPFAVMFKSISEIENYCYISDKERKILCSHISPILLLRVKDNVKISNYVAPKNPYLGCMIPYSPMHMLMMEKLDTPIVCTSANITDEPICIKNDEALKRLNKIADYLVVNDREIIRHVDDSVMKLTKDGKEIIIRRARGFVPKPIKISKKVPTILAFGGFLKNTIALSVDDYVILSQHIGDLETLEAINTFRKTIEDFLKFYKVKPEFLACDMHPEYISTLIAEEMSSNMGISLIKVQHHIAHAFSCISEDDITDSDKVLGISWDGTGYGTDGTIWGSEFLYINRSRFERLLHFKYIPLPGGEKAIKEVYRIGIALLILSNLRETVEKLFHNITNVKTIVSMIDKNIYVPSTGAGRLFDGISSLLGIRHYSSFEGQAAMELEFCIDPSAPEKIYPFEIKNSEIDWIPIIHGIVKDLENNIPKSYISKWFHDTITEIIKTSIKLILKDREIKRIVLSGGVFQNSYLIDKVIEKISEMNLKVSYNLKVPPNDGGISLGQIGFLANSL